MNSHIIKTSASLIDALRSLNSIKAEPLVLCVVDDNGHMVGTLTDGDSRRALISGVSVNGTDFYVQYKEGPHCVTTQSNKQKIAAMNFFKQTISLSPFITNVIWFTQIAQEDIDSLLTNNGKKMPSNVIGADFSFKEFSLCLCASVFI